MSEKQSQTPPQKTGPVPIKPIKPIKPGNVNYIMLSVVISLDNPLVRGYIAAAMRLWPRGGAGEGAETCFHSAAAHSPS